MTPPGRRSLRPEFFSTLLDGVPAEDLLALHGVGPKAIRVLTEELAARGMALG